ncbi:MAG: NADH-quinone oxidoreductase subunit L [Ignavibacteria bacterium]|nr:NADH-quinone oxidoreductase subunit L [Ignavibacteria bacterium]
MELIFKLSILILLLPLLSFVILIFFGKRIPRKGDWLANFLLFLNLALSFVVLALFLGEKKPLSFEFNWFTIGSFNISAGILIDSVSAIMLVVVNIVSSFVHLFSVKYMENDAKYSIYFAYLGLFTFSMLGIVLTNTILLMYVFWELVGLSSYLLIGFWYENKPPQEAAKKAFIVNRIGDVGFLTGIMILFFTLQTFNFSEIFNGVASGQLSGAWLTAAGILLFCGAVGKSAQFPLHVWLPDAMEGPTPVSALIHAATMVAAGVYMVSRIFIMLSADALTVIAYVGAVTAFISASIALTQNDIKRVLAYSTISQLGYMIMALGVGAMSYAMFHLVTHAFFKACLFLAAGSVIIGLHHVQDIREMGGLKKKMPLTYWTFLIATLALSGIPFTSGFLSKDSILSATMAFYHINGGVHIIIPVIAFLVAGMTAFYMFRLVIKTFLGEPRNTHAYEHCKESPVVMTLPLIVLSVLSFFAFYSLNPLDASGGWILSVMKTPESLLKGTQGLFSHIIEKIEYDEIVHHFHYTAMIISLIMAGTGILIAYLFYYWKKVNVGALVSRFKPVYNFLYNKWYFDELYGFAVVGLTLAVSRISKWFDNNIIDGIVNGSAYLTKKISGISGSFDKYFIDGLVNFCGFFVGAFGFIFKKFQTGKIQTYLTFLIIGIILLYLIFRTF